MHSLRELIAEGQYDLAAHRLVLAVVSVLTQTSFGEAPPRARQLLPERGQVGINLDRGDTGGRDS